MKQIFIHPDKRTARYAGDQFCACGSGCIRFPIIDDLGNFIKFACTRCAPRTVSLNELKQQRPIKQG